MHPRRGGQRCHPAILPSRVHRRPAAACIGYYKQSAKINNAVLAVTCRRRWDRAGRFRVHATTRSMHESDFGGMLGRQAPPIPGSMASLHRAVSLVVISCYACFSTDLIRFRTLIRTACLPRFSLMSLDVAPVPVTTRPRTGQSIPGRMPVMGVPNFPHCESFRWH